MARYDVDSSAKTYLPTLIAWLQPTRLRRGDAGSTRPAYWQCRLDFTSSIDEVPAAAFEEWEALDDGAAHTIELPPPNDVSGSDDVFSAVYLEIERWPSFPGVNVSGFSVLVSGAEFTS